MVQISIMFFLDIEFTKSLKKKYLIEYIHIILLQFIKNSRCQTECLNHQLFNNFNYALIPFSG